MRIWDVKSGTCEGVIEGHAGVVFSVIVCVWALGSAVIAENVSLSELYSPEKLDNILIPRAEWQPFAARLLHSTRG